MDLGALYERDEGKRIVGFRVIVLPGEERRDGVPACQTHDALILVAIAREDDSGPDRSSSENGPQVITYERALVETVASRS